MNFRVNTLLLLGAFICLTPAHCLHADLVYGTGPDGIYSIDPSTAQSTLLFDLTTWAPGGTQWQSGGNALTYDATFNQLIFTEQDGTRVGSYNLTTGVASQIANLDSFSSVTSLLYDGTTQGKLASGGLFYKNTYYFAIEGLDGSIEHSRLFSATLDATHTSLTAINVMTFGGGNPYLGDFGDMAVTDGGWVYGSSYSYGSADSLTGLWKLNLDNPEAGITTIDPNQAWTTQLAFSTDRTTLYAYDLPSNTFGTLDTTTGVFTQTGAISGATDYIRDLSESFTPVPEPSGLLLVTAGGLCLGLRRRRRE